MGLIVSAHGWGPWAGWGVAKTTPPTKIYHPYPTMMKLGTKEYMNQVTCPLSFANISIFSLEISKFAISKNTDIDCILILNFYFFNFFEVFKDCFNNHGYNFDDVSKNGYSWPS